MFHFCVRDGNRWVHLDIVTPVTSYLYKSMTAQVAITTMLSVCITNNMAKPFRLGGMNYILFMIRSIQSIVTLSGQNQFNRLNISLVVG